MDREPGMGPQRNLGAGKEASERVLRLRGLGYAGRVGLSREEVAAEMRGKYVEMLAMRVEHASEAEDPSRVRPRMNDLAARFPEPCARSTAWSSPRSSGASRDSTPSSRLAATKSRG